MYQADTRKVKKASLIDLPKELRWKILKFYLRGEPDIERQYPNKSNNRLVPYGIVHALMLVYKELHSTYVFQAERLVVYILSFNNCYRSF